jgi:hypothetical protein
MPVAMQLKARFMGAIPLSRYVHRNYIFNADKKQLKLKLVFTAVALPFTGNEISSGINPDATYIIPHHIFSFTEKYEICYYET